MANLSLGDAFLRLGADLGPLKSDLNDASALVRSEIKRIADNISGAATATPRFINAEAFAQASKLFNELNTSLGKVGESTVDTAKKISNLFAVIDDSSRKSGLNLTKVRNVQEVVEKAHIEALKEDVSRTQKANADKLADSLQTLRQIQAAEAEATRQREARERVAAADERLRGKELADQHKAALLESQRTDNLRTVQRQGIEGGASTRAQSIFGADIARAESLYQKELADAAEANKARLKEVQQEQVAVRDRFRDIQQSLTGLRTAGLTLTAFVTAPLIAGAEAALKYSGNMERVTVSLKNTAGGTEPAIKLLNQVKELALQSPFDFQVLLQGTKRLNSFGFEAKEVTGILKTLGDATAAIGGDSGTLNRLIKAIGDIKQKGFLTGEEIRQLGNAPLGAVKIIAEELGVTTDKILSGVKAKAISADEAIALILDGINKKFADEQKRQSETLPGQLNKLRTEYQFFAADVGKILTPAAKGLIGVAEDGLRVGKSLVDTYAGLPQPVQSVGLAIAGIAAASGPALASVGQLGLGIQGLTSAYGLLSKIGVGAAVGAAAPIVAIAAAIALVGATIRKVELENKFTPSTAVGPGEAPDRLDNTGAASFANSALGGFGPGEAPASAFKSNAAIDNAMKARADLLKKLSGDQASEAIKLREQLFSTAGLVDVKTEYDRISAAIDKLWNSLSRTQKTQATDTLEGRLRELGKQGIKTAAEVDATMNKLDARLEKAGGATTSIAPKIFEIPKGLDGATEFARIKQERLKKAYDDTAKGILDYQINLKALENVQNGSTDALDLERAAQLDINRLFEEFEPRIQAITEAHAHSDATIKGVVKSYEDLKAVLGQLPDKNLIEIGRATEVLQKDFGISPTKSISSLTAGYEYLLKVRKDNITFADGTELVSIKDLEAAWLKLAQAHLASGERLSAADEAVYQRIQKQHTGVKQLQQAYKDFGGQVSTIFNDVARDIADLFVPKKGAATPILPDNIVQSFKTAFETISGQGYANADQRLKDVTQSIINAGTAAQANAIALRTFGSQGPVIATLLRSGQLSVEQINYALRQGTDVLGKYSAEASTKLSKIAQLWKDVENALARALLETGAKAIARSISESLTPYIRKLEELLAKLPLVGAALAKVFGIGAPTASLPNLGGITIPGGGPAGSIPGIPGGLPTVTGPDGSPVSLPSGGIGGGAANTAAQLSSTLSTVSQVANIVGAVSQIASGIVAGVQAAHANALLDKIEKSVRGALNVLVGATDHDESIFGFTKKSSQFAVFIHDRLVEIGNKLIDPVTTTLESIANHAGKVQASGAVAGGGGDTYYISISGGPYASAGDTSIIQTAQSLTKLLKARGVGR